MKIEPKYIIGIGAIAGLLYLITRTVAGGQKKALFEIAIVPRELEGTNANAVSPNAGIYQVPIGSSITVSVNYEPEGYVFDKFKVATPEGVFTYEESQITVTVTGNTTVFAYFREV